LGEFNEVAEIGAIGFNWRIFGDSFQDKYEPRPVIERFVWASRDDFPPNRHLKSINRRVAVNRVINRHYCDITGFYVYPNGEPIVREGYGLSPIADYSVAQINHYYGKTREEFRKKMARGQAWISETNALQKFSYDEFSFNDHNCNDVRDESALEMLNSVQTEMEYLYSVLK
jgi:hypothetical protein